MSRLFVDVSLTHIRAGGAHPETAQIPAGSSRHNSLSTRDQERSYSCRRSQRSKGVSYLAPFERYWRFLRAQSHPMVVYSVPSGAPQDREGGDYRPEGEEAHGWIARIVSERPVVLENLGYSNLWSSIVCSVTSNALLVYLASRNLESGTSARATVLHYGRAAATLGSLPLGHTIGVWWHRQYVAAMSQASAPQAEGTTSGPARQAGRRVFVAMTVHSVYAGFIALVLGTVLLRMAGRRMPDGMDLVLLGMHGRGGLAFVIIGHAGGFLLWSKAFRLYSRATSSV
ncbi:hypothetical protein OH77DRAFT_856461 [Trametes cingulata]|nr:hypothetical protein OH77DRAFT_856461 [Trametes cingulata]